MNKYSKDDDTVLLCRIKDYERAFEVEYFPLAAKHIAMFLHTSNGSMFEDPFGKYQDKMKDEGKPDRSQGSPYATIGCLDATARS